MTYILATSVSIAIGLNASTEKTTPTRATRADAKHSVTIFLYSVSVQLLIWRVQLIFTSIGRDVLTWSTALMYARSVIKLVGR